MKKNDLKFTHALRQALFDQTNRLPAATNERLSNARRIAVARKKKQEKRPIWMCCISRALLAGFKSEKHSGWFAGIFAVVPILAGTILLIGLYHSEQDKRIVDIAEMDVAVLTDELPLSAYIDEGFKVFVTKNRE